MTDVPAAPPWLPAGHAVAEWDRVAAILTANRMLAPAHLSALGVVCALHGELLKHLMAGMMPTAALIGQYRALAREFGMTPSASTPVVQPSAPGTNKFRNNGRRPPDPRRHA